MIKKESGEKREFSTGAKKQAAEGKGTPVLIPGDALLDLAKHFEEGAVIHGSRNWEKGIPLSELLNSLERHIQDEKMGLTDEHHDRAIVWNAIVYLATKLRIKNGLLPKELDDMPRYKICGKITGKQAVEYRIKKATCGYYIPGGDSMYLHKDLQFHRGTGTLDRNYDFGEAPGYYESKLEAKAYLDTYLSLGE